MIPICRKDKEKVYAAIRAGKIDAAEMSFPNLIDDIFLTMKQNLVGSEKSADFPYNKISVQKIYD